ncbi:divalent metal ion exporter adaptor subunit IhpB [Afipia sp. TerB]
MKKWFRPIVAVLILATIAGFAFKTFTPSHTESESSDHAHEANDGRAPQDEHGGDRIVITDVKLAAAGVVMRQAASAVLSDTLQLNGEIRANQEKVVQVTPRFPGIVRDIRKRIGDVVTKDDRLASVESNQSLTAYELKAPISGTIIDRQISLGEYVSEQKPAFVVADLSTIWIDLSVYRQDIKRVRIGDEVLIDPDDGGGEIRATVSYLSPIGARDTQTALARVVLSNSDGRLRPGLFVTARLVLAKREVPVAVRVEAIQTLENRTVVFVREGDKVEARPVEIGEMDSRHAEVKAGLEVGESYAAENSFVVKAEIGKGEAEHGH